MSSGTENVLDIQVTKVTLSPGATLAQAFFPVGGQNSTIIKYGSGGSMEIFPVAAGTTISAAAMVTLQATGYLFGTSEAVSLDGGARFYLMATGATVTAYILRGLSSGTS